MIPPAESAAGVDTPPPALEGIEGRDTALDAQIAEGLGDLSNIDVIRCLYSQPIRGSRNTPCSRPADSSDGLLLVVQGVRKEQAICRGCGVTRFTKARSVHGGRSVLLTSTGIEGRLPFANCQ